MAETTENEQNQTQTAYKLDANGALAQRIDKLYAKWFDPRTNNLLVNKDENFSADESLDELTKITRSLRSIVSTSKDKAASELNNKLSDFLAGDANAAIDILANREPTDQLYKLICLINVTTTVSVLSGELADDMKPLDKGPMKNANVSAKNIEKIVVPIKQSKQMKTPSKFLGEVLPKTFAAVARHANIARAAEQRSRLFGNEVHNEPTEESMYYNLGQALIFVSTSFFAEANRALTEQGKRIASGKVANMDFSRLSAKEQDKLMTVMHATFRKFSNYTVELNTLSSINDKMILDAAFAAWYMFMSNEEKAQSGFTEDSLRKLPNAVAFSRKYKSKFDAAYMKFSNKFIDGMTEALKKEQETVEKDWFQNPITGEKEFRRGRLAGHGNKFMHTPPMKWLNEKMKQKKWFSLWCIPKLGMLTLNILTNPTLRKLRKKLTGTLFAGLRSFAQGVKEGFDSTGRSTEITYEDVIKKLKEAEAELREIHSEKTYVTNESTLTGLTTLLTEAEVDYEEVKSKLNNVLEELKTAKALHNKAMSDEYVKSDVDAYNEFYDNVNTALENNELLSKLSQLLSDSDDNTTPDDVKDLAANVKAAYEEFTDDKTEFDQKMEKDNASNAQDKQHTDSILQVGERSVEICEDVFKTLNKYIARQWNLFAAHSNHADMPLCVNYITIDAPELVNGAVQKREVHEMTLTDWMEHLYLTEADTTSATSATDTTGNGFGARTDVQQRRADALGSYDEPLRADRAMRDVRDNRNGNNGNETAKYPMKFGDKYRYHGLEIATATNSNKTGFGVFAERLAKIAEPVEDFYTYVVQLGNDSAKKTFNNDEEVDTSSKFAGPLESIEFEVDEPLNEDIGNKLVNAYDKIPGAIGKGRKALNKFAKKKSPALAADINKGIGKAIGSLAHGITHTATADKDRELERTIEDYTGLVYKYNRDLKPAYVRDGAKILAKHSLTHSAQQSFKDITELANALIESDIANARSIKTVKDALNTFAEKTKSIKFAPCKTIIDYELADKINNGGINDQNIDDLCMIKGVCIRNFSGAKEYARQFNANDIDDVFFNRDAEATAAEIAGPGPDAPSTPAPASEPAPESAPAPAADATASTTAPTDEAPTAPAGEAKEEPAEKTDVKPDAETAPVVEPKSEPAPEAKPESAAAPKADDNSTTNKVVIKQKDWDSARRAKRKKWYMQGAEDENGNKYPSAARINNASVEVNIDGLSKLFEEINTIDWKDILNG